MDGAMGRLLLVGEAPWPFVWHLAQRRLDTLGVAALLEDGEEVRAVALAHLRADIVALSGEEAREGRRGWRRRRRMLRGVVADAVGDDGHVFFGVYREGRPRVFSL